MQKTPELETMWVEYMGSREIGLRNRLIEAYLPLVDYLAERIHERLPRCVELDEVRAAAEDGLMDAVGGFDLARNIKFETYASLRIRGAILDGLRSRDWVPRLVRSRAQKFGVAVRKLQAKIGRPPAPNEIMTELKISLEEYELLLKDVARLAIYSLDQHRGDEGNSYEAGLETGSENRFLDRLVDSRHPDPIKELEKHEVTGFILGELIDKEREILELYYFEFLTMKEIGKLLRLSESRVCQIHGQAINRLKGAFAEHLEPFAA